MERSAENEDLGIKIFSLKPFFLSFDKGTLIKCTIASEWSATIGRNLNQHNDTQNNNEKRFTQH